MSLFAKRKLFDVWFGRGLLASAVIFLLVGACDKPLSDIRGYCGVWLIDLEPVAKREAKKMLSMLRDCMKGGDAKIKKEISTHIKKIEKNGIPYKNLWFVLKKDHAWVMYYGNSGKIRAGGSWSGSKGKITLLFKKELRTRAALDSFFPYKDLGVKPGKKDGGAVDWVCRGFLFSNKGGGKWLAGYIYQIYGKGAEKSGELPAKKIPVIRIYP